MNFAKFLRTYFLLNTSWELLLSVKSWRNEITSILKPNFSCKSWVRFPFSNLVMLVFKLIEVFFKKTQRSSLKKSCSYKFCNIHWKIRVLESVSNKVANLKTYNFNWKRLQQRCFPVNIAKFLRALILNNICKRVLLSSDSSDIKIHHTSSSLQ